MENPKSAICYSFKVDSSSPSHLKRSDRIFDADIEKHISYSPNNTMVMTTVYSDSKTTASMNVAADLKVSGNYGAFSGSASMSVSKNCDSSIETVRLDAKCTAGIAFVTPKGEFKTFPEQYLSESFRKAVERLDFEEFADTIGVFYATDLNLGGCVTKSYTMQASKEDSETTVKAELEATYGKGCFGVTGNSSNSVTTRNSNSKSSMKTEWKAQGGDTTIWLGCSFGPGDDAEATAKTWAQSVNADSAYPISFTLKPIWHLLKKVDAKKGAGLEKYLTDLWAKSASEFKPSRFLELEQKIANHPRVHDIIKRAKSHKDWCRDQAAKAQGWIDTWTAFAGITRNKNWKSAAEQGVGVMDKIVAEAKGGKTVSEFKDWLHDQWKDRDVASQHSWGVNGYDSEESNRVQRAHRDCIGDIKKMIS